jgi:hypothetical protein
MMNNRNSLCIIRSFFANNNLTNSLLIKRSYNNSYLFSQVNNKKPHLLPNMNYLTIINKYNIGHN